MNTINSLHNQVVTGTVSNVVTYNAGTFTYNVEGADVTVSADTYKPTATSLTLTTTQSGGIDTIWNLKYVGRKSGLIYSSQTPVPSISGALQDLMSYTMPAGTLAVVGDELLIRANFLNADTGTAAISLKNYVDFGTIQILYPNAFPSIRRIYFEIRVEMLSTTSVKYEVQAFAAAILGDVAAAYVLNLSTPVVVPDLSANTLIIKTECDGLIATDISCSYLTVELIPKI